MIKLPLSVVAFGFTWALFVFVATSYDFPILSPLLNTVLFGLALSTLVWAGFEFSDLVSAMAATRRHRRPLNEAQEEVSE